MYCINCKFRDESKTCTSDRLVENFLYGRELDNKNNKLIYSYDEGGYFTVEDYFGCVHFETR